MDQQLKQRLIGVTIVVALVVIFVPMLFDKTNDRGRLSALGIPDIPDEVLEKPLELPKTAEDLAPKESEEPGEAQADGGFRIVPLNDEPPQKPAATSTNETKPPVAGEPEGAVGVASDEGSPPVKDKPDKKAAKEDQSEESTRAASSKPAKGKGTDTAAIPLAESKKSAAPVNAKSAAPKAQSANAARGARPEGTVESAPAKADGSAAKSKPSAGSAARPPVAAPSKPNSLKKSEAPKPQQPRQAAAKAGKSKSSLLLQDAENDADEMPIPVPAKAEPPPVRSKSPAVRQTEKAAKTKETAKSSSSPRPDDGHRTDANAEKADTEAAAPAKKPPARTATAKASSEADKPAKQADTVKTKPKTPKAWAVQAGSFTEEASAKGLVEKLKQSKFPAYLETVKGERGAIYRVKVGSEQDRGRAEETLKQIEGTTGISGIITPKN